jgi:hypothetical protein
MPRALAVIVLVLLAIPATALANEAKLHGGWNLAAISYAGQRIDMPAEMNLHVAFDKAKKSWTFKTDYEGAPTEVTGQYRLQGDQLTLSLQGEEAPPMAIAFVEGELHVTVTIDPAPNAPRYTMIAKRGAFKARPKPPPEKPVPAKPAQPSKPKTQGLR